MGGPFPLSSGPPAPLAAAADSSAVSVPQKNHVWLAVWLALTNFATMTSKPTTALKEVPPARLQPWNNSHPTTLYLLSRQLGGIGSIAGERMRSLCVCAHATTPLKRAALPTARRQIAPFLSFASSSSFPLTSSPTSRRGYAVQAGGKPVFDVFNRRAKWLQKERAAANVEASRQADYLKDEVAIRLCERLLVRLFVGGGVLTNKLYIVFVPNTSRTSSETSRGSSTSGPTRAMWPAL